MVVTDMATWEGHAVSDRDGQETSGGRFAWGKDHRLVGNSTLPQTVGYCFDQGAF